MTKVEIKNDQNPPKKSPPQKKPKKTKKIVVIKNYCYICTQYDLPRFPLNSAPGEVFDFYGLY